MKMTTKKTGRALVSLALVIAASVAVIPTSSAAGLPSARLVAPLFDSKNSVDATGDIAQYYSAGTKAFYAYIGHGTKISLTYLVTTDGTKPAVNQELRLQVNAPYSGSKANWLTEDGKPVTAQVDANFGLELVGKTDSMGKVTFVLTNTDTTGLEEVPTSPTQDRGAIKPARLYGTMKPVIPGKGDKEADTDLITLDITKSEASVLPAVATPTPSATATPTPTTTATPEVTSVAPAAQKIASVATSLVVGKSLTLPAKSVSGLAIKWVSTTKTVCTVSGSKLTAKKKGACSVTGTNAGDSKNAALSVAKKITVK